MTTSSRQKYASVHPSWPSSDDWRVRIQLKPESSWASYNKQRDKFSRNIVSLPTKPIDGRWHCDNHVQKRHGLHISHEVMLLCRYLWLNPFTCCQRGWEATACHGQLRKTLVRACRSIQPTGRTNRWDTASADLQRRHILVEAIPEK